MFFLCFKFISNITIPKNIGKIKINWNKKLTTTSTLYQTAFASKGLRFTHENGNLRLGLCNGTKLRRTDLESESLLFVEFICHCLTQLEELKTIWLWRRHFRATFSDRPVAACCCQLHCLRYVHERERIVKELRAASTRVRIILKTHFFTNQPSSYMKAVNAVNKTLFLKPFSRVFFLWIRRIFEFWRVDYWNGILSNSVKHVVSFHPDSCGRGLRFTSVAELRFKEHVTLKHLLYWRCKQRRVSLARLINLLTQCKYSW